MRPAAAVIAFALGLSTGAAAAQPPANAVLATAPPALPQAPALPSGLYRIAPDRTRVSFALTLFGLTTYRGQFLGASGTLLFDPARIAASRLDVTVPLSGLSTASDRLDAMLKSPQWFDAVRYPVMTFHSTAVTPTGPVSADVAGDLTLHGVTRPVTLKAKFITAAGPAGRAAGFEARGRIKRSKFGVTRYVSLIGDNVDLVISADFERARS